jgi:hypothetical protein
MDNGPAMAAGTTIKVQEAGEKIGVMFEISTIKWEGSDFVSVKSGEFVSLLQCMHNACSSASIVVI